MLSDLQRLLVHALLSPDPAAELERAATDAGLDPETSQLLQGIDPGALKVTRRIVRKLRLQRLAADPEIDALMEGDPESFNELFQAYDAEVLPRSTFAADELRAFRAFVSGLPS